MHRPLVLAIVLLAGCGALAPTPGDNRADPTLATTDDSVSWRFLAEDGTVVEEGTGWLWPFGNPFDSGPPSP